MKFVPLRTLKKDFYLAKISLRLFCHVNDLPTVT